MKILVKFPTRGRREKFFEVFEKYRTLANDLSSVYFLISMDDDDAEMFNDEVIERFTGMTHVYAIWSQSSSKIYAVNRDIDEIELDWDILLLASDDMVPQIEGWDERIINDMKENFPDTDGVLWYNDGFQGDRLNTLCILGKKYYDRFGYIYYPKYRQLWSDNEFTEVSRRLGKVKYFNDVIIRHEHPIWGFGEMDKMYKSDLEASVSDYDKEIFLKRFLNNFDLKNQKV